MKILSNKILTLFFINSFFLNYSQFTNVSNQIKSFVIGKNYNNKDVFNLNESIEFSFDELDEERKNYYYTIDHFDYNWKLSNVQKSYYIDGFDEIKIKNISYSFNTLQSYTSYKFSIPNDKIVIKETGNYKVSIYDSIGNKVLEKRFTIVNNKLPVQIVVSRTKDLENYQTNQKISLNVLCKNCSEYYNNNSEIKIIIRKNDNWNDIVIIENPKFLTSNGAVYDDIIFKGGNEFYNFDISEIRSNNYRIKNWTVNNLYEANLMIDKFDSSEIYNYNPDINGNFVIQSSNQINSVNELDYVRVNFQFENKNLNSTNEVYLQGMFNNYDKYNNYKLNYDHNKNLFSGSFLFKQGFYNYKFASKSTLPDNELQTLENDFWETENLYSIFIYFKKNNEMFFRVVGFNSASSIF